MVEVTVRGDAASTDPSPSFVDVTMQRRVVLIPADSLGWATNEETLMSRTRIHNLAISLDGFATGEPQTL